MYLNFKKIAARGLSPNHIFLLQAIKQREASIIAIYNELISDLEREEFVQYIKGRTLSIEHKIRISKKGSAFIDSISIPGFDNQMMAFTKKLVDIYECYGRSIGNLIEVNNRLQWFIKITGFNENIIENAIIYHVQENQHLEYDKFMSLQNLIWKPNDPRFPGVKSLNQSKLFDIIIRTNEFAPYYFTSKKKTDFEYLFELCQITPPLRGNSNFTITGSFKSDNELFNRLKDTLKKQLKEI